MVICWEQRYSAESILRDGMGECRENNVNQLNAEKRNMDDDKYAKEILKTGFVLENKVGDTLRRSGWTVISNKYYEDDFEGSVREIDLLAYKVSKVQHVNVYTTILISCKKSEADIWGLIARSINLGN